MQDGYFTTHEVCSLLRATGTLKTVEYPPIPTTNPVDFHFTLTTLQQLYMQQSRTKQNDDRMSLMKDMVKDVMSGPMAANEKNVASKCLMNDILQLRAEEATLKEHLAEETKECDRVRGALEQSLQGLEEHRSSVANYQKMVEERNERVTELETDDVKTLDSLHARCTRLLAMLSFVYPIRQIGSSYTLRNIEIPEFELRTIGQVSDDAVNRTNAALGFLAHLVQLLGKYFMIPLPYSIDYRASFSVIFDVHEEPPMQYPLYLGAAGTRSGSIGTAVTMLRENVMSILRRENIPLEMEEPILCGLDKLFKKYLVY